ncbi:MAG: DUF4160 domain-containing protein [Bacteroidales bacterium]
MSCVIIVGYNFITYICIYLKLPTRPTLLILFGLRFYFYSREHEPIHIHVECSDGVAKFVIEEDVILIENKGLKPKDIRLAESILEENKINFREEWNHYFGV